MQGSGNSRQNVFLLVVLLAAQLLLMSLDARNSPGASATESITMRLTSPFVATARWIGDGAQRVVTDVSGLFDTRAENRRLIQELEALQTDMQQTREAATENVRLRNLLDMRQRLEPESVAAFVVTAQLTGDSKTIVLDRGSKDGVRVDASVISWGGAVGRVVSVSRSYSKVQLISDASGGVAGVVQRSRAQGQVQGTGGTHLNMLFVPRFADVIHGDRVVTSGLEGIFPRGYGIGRVVGIQESPAEGTKQIRLEPEVQFERLEEVLILTHPAIDPFEIRDETFPVPLPSTEPQAEDLPE